MRIPIPAGHPTLRGFVAQVTAVLVTATAALAATAPPAGAAPKPAPATAAKVAAFKPTAFKPTKLTLITGDTVTYSRDSEGRASVSVDLGAGRDELTYQAQEADTGYYVIPKDAQGYVASGVLDKELFNLDRLAASGYADTTAAELPVIVQYGQELSASALGKRAGTIKGGTKPRALASVNGAAVRVTKARTGEFWTGFKQPGNAGLRKVWLDAKATALDDVSNAQIGAATAWAAGFDGTGTQVGIIDTGIDATHPDVAGKVTAARSFVPAGSPGGGAPDDVTDRHGHGTHVASIVAGTGAASGGRYKGVAPGATLTIAKALDDKGSALNSTIIEAMQWQAATAKVRIVSMSLGSGPTDGTDPLSQAVDDLTAEYGTLFVVAAGNDGPGRRTVASPGAATSALTVGAVDSADHLADFSSRGPRLGDSAIKPEITAPGVATVAARAAGTSMGTPLDARYTAASGTSMATPHVAAAAALLGAKHPKWTAKQIKDALVGTAKDGGYSPYDQGAGRLDVARAITQDVFADTATFSEFFAYPYPGQTRTKAVTFRNEGAADATLDLSATLTRADGGPAPAGLATLAPATVTVPAGGTATADLVFEPTVGQSGRYTGRVTAAGGSTRLGMPMAVFKQAEQQTLTVRVVGDPAWIMQPYTSMTAVRLNDTEPALDGEYTSVFSGQYKQTGEPNTYEVQLTLARGGIYSLDAIMWFRETADAYPRHGLLTLPEVRLDGDTTVTLDARKLVPVRVSTPLPSEQVTLNYLYTRTTASGRLWAGATVFAYSAAVRGGLWVLPTTGTATTIGKSTLVIDQMHIKPQVTMALTGGRRVDLHPRYIAEEHSEVPKFTADRRVRLASQAELRAGQDVRGKLVYLEPDTLANFRADLSKAIAAGAAGTLTDSAYAWIMVGPNSKPYMRIPLLVIDHAEAALVTQALARQPRPQADLGVELVTPYQYKLAFYVRGAVPSKLDFRPKASEFTRIETTYHAQFPTYQGEWGTGENFGEVIHTFVPEQTFSIKTPHGFPGPARRTEYYNVTGPDTLWMREYTFYDPATGAIRAGLGERGFAKSTSEREDWNEGLLPIQLVPGPQAPEGFTPVIPCDGCRQGDKLRVRSLAGLALGQYSDLSDNSHSYQGAAGVEENHLYGGDTEIAPSYDAAGLPYYTVPEGVRSYRFTSRFQDAFAAAHNATAVTTTWNFRSGRPASGNVKEPNLCLDGALWGDTAACAWLPLIQLQYELGLAPDDTAPTGPYTFTVTPSGAKPRDVRVWTSTDAGAHWTPALVLPGSGGSYKVVTWNTRGTGTVWLRAQARDAAGNSVEQVIADAYRKR
ncbi:S8 family serine peptidase [Phytohabitans aurantiacus]|uniref:Peptidase n=1 Tax=Phytohabitans aurantiacus TaxID=3016789 RepID=A0ABQ5R1V1_9ACTN|nr:S8 family serine peptidase [Phytohabitans aurantiacus]GLH99555.1 peptidase [Phytohabitans aurantiacus]